jgi:23S rRNA maturation-related 3'-5' exoribonuclease YhaM
MYACRASTSFLKMTQNSFSDFYKSLLDLVKNYEKKTMLKVEQDLESNIIRIFGENIDSLVKAKNSLEDVAELAYATAEHHPFWGLLYHCAQISKVSLDKWNDDLTKEELDEIEWSIAELQNACKKLKDDLQGR